MSISVQPISIPTGTSQVDVVHSSVGFEVPCMGISTFSGTVRSFQATLADGTLTGPAQIASLVTKDENLQGGLLSPEFFDAERYPTVSFSGTATRSEAPKWSSRARSRSRPLNTTANRDASVGTSP
jgi:polyisoprenoid-binding protein YceI